MNEKFDIARVPLEWVADLGLVPLQTEEPGFLFLSDGSASKERIAWLQTLAQQPVRIRTLDTVSSDVVRAYLYAVRKMAGLLCAVEPHLAERDLEEEMLRIIDRLNVLLKRRYPQVL